MPTIAAKVLAETPSVRFYWHLGDLRLGSDVDEDMRQLSQGKMTTNEYWDKGAAWTDFVGRQIAPFQCWSKKPDDVKQACDCQLDKTNGIPVHLGIGNHELYMRGTTATDDDSSRDAFIRFFHSWFETGQAPKQCPNGDAPPEPLRAYYHWQEKPVDFIYLDNSMECGFDEPQLKWLDGVLNEDKKRDDIHAVVVGMHRALPNSLACGHSMNGDPPNPTDPDIQEKEKVNAASTASGREAYDRLWLFRNITGKQVYVLASHSHFYMENIFDTPYWNNRTLYWDKATTENENSVTTLNGRLIGTAGARRYRLPENLPLKTLAITYAYGYLLGTVHADGTIEFEFQQVTEGDVPPEIVQDYHKPFVDFCFLANRDDNKHVPAKSCSDQ